VRILDSIDALPARLRFAATVGVFDGMHRGHGVIVTAIVGTARRLAAEPVVITFEPHPQSVLRGVTPLLLCDPAEKLARLKLAGVGTTVIQGFDRTFSEQSAESFVERLARGRELAGLVMSSESAFGHDRAGTAESVRRLADEGGWKLLEVPTLDRRGGRISSGSIRSLIEVGRLAEARRLLGRRYAVIGEVVHGDARGRSLGFPTANLAFTDPVTLPPNGIYAIRASWGGRDPLNPARTRDGVASLGVRPTFGGGRRLLEVHLLDFDEDIYGVRLRVEFVRRQRGEKRFSGVEGLIAQMTRDAARARRILHDSPAGHESGLGAER
jgi:riboflavin kinase/FMN adenylyltransferase